MTAASYPLLFSPIDVAGLILDNRIVMPPMATNFATEAGGPSDRMLGYYLERARGGAGLIIVESTNVDYPAGSSGATQLRADEDRFIPGLAALAETIHAGGAKAGIQLNHAGASTKTERTCGVQPVGPSPVPASPSGQPPRELSPDEIDAIATRFASAAGRVKRAGFDMVEIHGAHAYLVAAFMSPLTNRRTDAFGGSLQNRMRFPLTIVERVRAAVGPRFPISFRISMDEFVPGGRGLEESVEMVRLLESAGVSIIHASAATGYSMAKQIEPMSYPEGWRSYLAAAAKKAVSIPVIAVGCVRTPETAERILGDGHADLVAVGRGLIADPSWPAKARSGKSNEIRRCIGCNAGCAASRVYGDTPVRCAVNPEGGRESMLSTRFYLPHAAAPQPTRRVVVIGGGPAGLTAAAHAASLGHTVTLFEKERLLGGQLRPAMTPPGKDKISWLLDYLERWVENSGASVRKGVEATAETVLHLCPDVVILATGSEPRIPGIPGIHGGQVITARKALMSADLDPALRVTVAGGGSVGCETALHLAGRGHRVTLVEMLPQLAVDADPIQRGELIHELERQSIRIETSTELVSIDGGNAIARRVDPASGKAGDEFALAGDLIVLALGAVSYDPMSSSLAGRVEQIIKAGDCNAPRKILDAVWEGYLAALRF